MQIITAPDMKKLEEIRRSQFLSYFMAGGITGCPDWQSEVLDTLKDAENKRGMKIPAIFLNPRRQEFDVRNVDEESVIQIAWEYEGLRHVDCTYFWFPKEGKCMITLFELGRALGRRDDIRVGCHPEYERAFDVHQQMRLEMPNEPIYKTLEDLYDLHDNCAAWFE